MAASDASLQFQEPAHPHISSAQHPSSHPDDSAVKSSGTVDPAHNSATTTSPPPAAGTAGGPAGMQRQGSVSKIAHLAKQMVKSPAEEKEHLKLEKAVSDQTKKGPVDVGTMEA